MLQENPYKMRAGLLTCKYKGVLEKFATYRDDRAIVVNLFGMLIDACKEMEGVKNNSICVAFNNYFNDQEAEMDRIGALDKGEPFYVRTDEALAGFASWHPDVDGQK